MSDKLNEIQKAIDGFQMDEARRLLREELQTNPTAEGYYLASQAAVNHGQRVEFLKKAIELDPFHKEAHDELAGILPPAMDAPDMTATTPVRKQKAKTLPSYPLTSISKRFLAILIDWIILAVIGGIFGAIFGGLFAPNLPVTNVDDPAYIEAFTQFQLTVSVISILINAAYHIYFMTRTNGQTPGKQITGIRVVKKDGAPITWIDALLRNVIGYALSSLFLLGYIWALFDSENQGWHDKIAGTIVVDDQQQAQS